SLEVWNALPSIFLKAHGIKVSHDINSELVSMNLPEAMEYFKQKFQLKSDISAMVNECNEIIRDAYLYTIPLMPFAKEYLYFLQSNEIKMCVATASDYQMTCIALQRCKIDTFFEFILTEEETGKSKTYPDIFIQSSKKLGEDISDCVVFEDATYAMKTASKAGFTVYGIKSVNHSSSQENLSLHCDKCFSGYEELLEKKVL
ncbi:MAG: HAD family phosphatase, partial [Candidatus Theseobacter exili]|nr:HAD family phosphatase [Candidatus Theseobacter exili]